MMANPFVDMDLVCLFNSPLAVVKVVTKEGDTRPEWQRKFRKREAERRKKKAFQNGDAVAYVDPHEEHPEDIVPLDMLNFAAILKQDIKDKEEMRCIDVLDTEAEWLAIQDALNEADLLGKRKPLTLERLRQAVLADPQILIISGCLMEEMTDKKAWAHRCRPLGVDAIAKLFSDEGKPKKKKRNLQLVCLTTPCSEEVAIVLRQTLQVPHMVYFDSVPSDRGVLKSVFYWEFFDAMVGNKLSVGKAFVLAQQEVAKQRRDPKRQLLEEDPLFYQMEAAKYKLLSMDESATLALPKGGFMNRTAPVPHNVLPAFLRGPDEWAETYEAQRNQEMLELLSTVVEGKHDTCFLWGPAGMGKSMIAKRIANYSFSSRSRFKGGVFYIDRRQALKGHKDAEGGLEPVEVQVARALAEANKGAREFKINNLASNPWKAIEEVRAKWGKQGVILMVLDNMDPHSVGEKQLSRLLRSLTSTEVKAPPMRVLVARRAWPSVTLQNAGGLIGESVYAPDDDDDEFEDFELMGKPFALGKEPVRELLGFVEHEALEVLCELRTGEKESAQGPWKWKREADLSWWVSDKRQLSHVRGLDEETEHWLVVELLQGNPGMVRLARKVAVEKKVGRPQDFRQAWTLTHGEMEEYDKGGDSGLKGYRLPADKILQLFGAGDVSSEDCAGRSGWHDWSDHGESDSVHGRDRCRRRRRDGGGRRGGRRHRRHRSRRREGAGKSRLRELREEHERLLAENRDLKGSVRRIEAVLRRGLRL